MSVGDRLGRLLFIVPYVVHRDGVPVSELAEVLKVSSQQIEADINLLSMVGKPPLTPDHLIDLYIEDEIVYVQLDQNFTRPLSLTHEEARALVLGAKLVGHLGGLGDELEKLLERIVAELNPVDREAVEALASRVVVHGTHPELDPYASALRQACQAQRVVHMLYYSVSSDRQKRYTIKPLALFTHGGEDYLVALDSEADDQEKLFRLDRIGEVTATDALFVAPPQVDLEKFRTQRLYFGGGSLHASVRFGRRLERQIKERFAPHEIIADAPNDLQVQVTTSSAAWLARWVLSFGLDAEVLAPAPCRDAVYRLCRDAAVAYAQPVTSSATADDPHPEGPSKHSDPGADAAL